MWFIAHQTNGRVTKHFLVDLGEVLSYALTNPAEWYQWKPFQRNNADLQPSLVSFLQYLFPCHAIKYLTPSSLPDAGYALVDTVRKKFL